MRSFSRLKIGLIIFLIIIFFILNLTPLGKEVKNFFYLISSPIQKTFWKMGDEISDFFEMVKEMKNLKKENEELKLKIQELLAELGALSELKKENEILREALKIGLEKEFKLVLAEVIGKDISQDSIFINKGFEDGILKGSPVITQQKTLLGKISQVNKNFSKVMLITNKETTFVAKVSGTEIYGNIKGKGNFQLLLKNIPRDEKIKEGDLIVTTSLGGVFPEGLLVGKIKEVKRSDVKLFQETEIIPFFDIKEIKYLFIITNFQPIQ